MISDTNLLISRWVELQFLISKQGLLLMKALQSVKFNGTVQQSNNAFNIEEHNSELAQQMEKEQLFPEETEQNFLQLNSNIKSTLTTSTTLTRRTPSSYLQPHENEFWNQPQYIIPRLGLKQWINPNNMDNEKWTKTSSQFQKEAFKKFRVQENTYAEADRNDMRFQLEFKENEEVNLPEPEGLTARLSSRISNRVSSLITGRNRPLSETIRLIQRSRIRGAFNLEPFIRVATDKHFHLVQKCENILIFRERHKSSFLNMVLKCVANQHINVYSIQYIPEHEQVRIIAAEGALDKLMKFRHLVRHWLCQRGQIMCQPGDVEEFVEEKFRIELQNLNRICQQSQFNCNEETLDGLMEKFIKLKEQILTYISQQLGGFQFENERVDILVEKMVLEASEMQNLFEDYYKPQENTFQQNRLFVKSKLNIKECFDNLHIEQKYRLNQQSNLFNQVSKRLDRIGELESLQQRLQHIENTINLIEKTFFQFYQGKMTVQGDDNLFSLTIFAILQAKSPITYAIVKMLQCYVKALNEKIPQKFIWVNAAVDLVNSWRVQPD